MKFAYNNFALIDKGLLEVFGPTGLGQLTHRIGLRLATAQTGRVYDYGFVILAGLLGALLLIDLAVNPTGAAFIEESANLLNVAGKVTPDPLL